jgi:hypothetical protein
VIEAVCIDSPAHLSIYSSHQHILFVAADILSAQVAMETEILKSPLDDDIYLGFWINRVHGIVKGATLTLDRSSGGLLIAFLALLEGHTLSFALCVLFAI